MSYLTFLLVFILFLFASNIIFLLMVPPAVMSSFFSVGRSLYLEFIFTGYLVRENFATFLSFIAGVKILLKGAVKKGLYKTTN